MERETGHIFTVFRVRLYMVAYLPHELPVNLILISIWM